MLATITAAVVVVKFQSGEWTRDTVIPGRIVMIIDYLTDATRAKNNFLYSSLFALVLLLIVRLVRPRMNHRKIIRKYVFPIPVYIQTSVFYMWSGIFAGTFYISQYIRLIPGANDNWIFCVMAFVEGLFFWYLARYAGTLFRVKAIKRIN